MVKGYKVFNKDFTCRGFQYKVGKTYEMVEKPELCNKGFHFCKKAVDCFNYYEFDSENKVAEIVAHGDVYEGEDKCATNKIEIVKEIPWIEVLELVNTGKGNTGHNNSGHNNSGDRNSGNLNSGDWNGGDRNSGHWNGGDRNSGDRNSGDRNSGHWNSGDRNSGDRNSGHWNSGHLNSGDRNSGDLNSGNLNSGDWNSCDRETGFFNSENSSTIRVFNKPCDIKKWRSARKPDFLFFDTVEFIDGKATSIDYKDAFKKSYEKAKRESDFDEQIEMLKALPNFNADVFYEISGIRIDDTNQKDCD